MVFQNEKNLGKVLVPIGAVGLMATFGTLYKIAEAKHGVSTPKIVGIGTFFLISLLLTALGSQVKIVSCLSSCDADDK